MVRVVSVEKLAGAAVAVPALLLAALYLHHVGDGNAVKWLVLAASLPLLCLVRWKIVDDIDLAALLILGWAGLSLIWSPDPLFGAYRLAQFAALTVLFIGMRRYEGSVFPAAVAGSIGALVSLQFGGFGNPNFTAEFLILCLPFLMVRPTGWIVSGLVVTYLVTDGSAVEIAAIITLGLAILVRMVGGWRGPAVALMIAASVLAIMPLLPWGLGDAGVYRIQLALNTVAMWWAYPIAGVGLGGFDFVYPGFSHFDLELGRGGARAASQAHQFVGAAHNEPLQLLAELGLIGGLLALYFLRKCLVSPIETPEQRAALASLGLGLGLALVEFPLQTPGSGAVLAVALALVARRVVWQRHEEQLAALGVSRSAAPGLGRLGIVAAAFVLAAFSAQSVRANAWFHVTAERITADPGLAFVANAKAHDLAPWDKAIRLQLFRSLARTQAMEAGDIGHEAANAIYKISASAVPDNAGLLLDRVGYLVRTGMCALECDAVIARLALQPYVTQVGELAGEVREATKRLK